MRKRSPSPRPSVKTVAAKAKIARAKPAVKKSDAEWLLTTATERTLWPVSKKRVSPNARTPPPRQRAAALQHLRAQPGADDPEVIARNQARRALEAAREQHIAERNAAKAAAQALKDAGDARLKKPREALAAAEEIARNRAGSRPGRSPEAARDARYAARKKRK